MRKYQPAKVTEWKNWIRLQAQQQLSQIAEFKPFVGAVGVEVDFIFSLPKSASKREKQLLNYSGVTLWKAKRPDLGDNLFKGMADALTEIVWFDDSQIVEIHSRKFYGASPMIKITVSEKEPVGVLIR
jgi:Holliday junction resolvase RusA-like endonuclease